MNWYLKVIKHYAKFDGRARRKEYWMFVLFNVIFLFALNVIESVVRGQSAEVLVLPLIYGLALLVPSLAVGVRRLHDTDRSGWWMLIALLPLVGGLVLLFFFAGEGTKGDNRFGADPKQPGMA